MSELLEYKGYHGTIEIDFEEEDLFGEVLFIRDTLLFRGRTVKEIGKNFHSTINHYLAFCEKKGKTPNKPLSGSVTARIGEELHRSAAIAAEREGVSLNEWITSVVADKTGIKRTPRRRGRPPKRNAG